MAISPSRTTGRSSIAPTARIAACGGLITAAKLSIPNIPRLETVKVRAGELGRGDRAVAHPLGQRPRLVADLPEALAVGVEDRRDDERVAGGDGDADVDPRVELEAAVAVGTVRARVLAQGQAARL